MEPAIEVKFFELRKLVASFVFMFLDGKIGQAPELVAFEF